MTKICATCPHQRSDEEHRTLFGVISMAFSNWPHGYAFTPTDAEHLRAWLLIEAGHTDTYEVPEIMGVDPKVAVELGKFFCNGKPHFRMKRAADGFVLLKPRTIKKDECPVKDFRRAANACYELMEAITGVTVEMYKKNKDAAA